MLPHVKPAISQTVACCVAFDLPARISSSQFLGLVGQVGCRRQHECQHEQTVVALRNPFIAMDQSLEKACAAFERG